MALDLKKLVKNAFKSVKSLTNAPVEVVYHRVTPGVYNPATDTTSDTEVTYTIEVIVATASEAEIVNLPADRITQKVLIAGADLPVAPGLDDYIMISGRRWNVKRVKLLPTNPLFIVFTQEP